LPVLQATKALGLRIPQSLLARADEVIQSCYRSLADVLRLEAEAERFDD
jgi:hypothetical protein